MNPDQTAHLGAVVEQSDLGPYCLQYRVPKYKTSLLSYRDYYLESEILLCHG